MLQRLHRSFPRNYFFEMEIAATFVREGDADAAIAMYQHIKQKMRASVSGYGCVDAGRLCFQIAALQSRPDTAARYYEEAAGTNGADPSLAAEAYLRRSLVPRGRSRRAGAGDVRSNEGLAPAGSPLEC